MRVRTFLAAVFAVVTCAGGLAVGVAAPAAAAAPAVMLNTISGQPSSTVLVSGTGFGDSEAVNIYFGTTDEAVGITNGKGGFSNVSVTVPASASPGVNYITAVGQHSGLAGQAAFVVSTNWSQYRDGSRHHGYNSTENVLSPSNVSGIDQAWAFTTGNEIDSSPAVVTTVSKPVGAAPPVAEESVYIGSWDHSVYALNAATGAKEWSFPTGGDVESSPGVFGNLVVVGSDDGNVYGLNATSGAKVWSFDAGAPVTSPALAGSDAYVASDNGDVYALNAATGAEVWSYSTGYFIGSSPSVAGGRVYIGTGGSGDNVYAFNAATGSLEWSYSTGGLNGDTAAAYGKVYVSSATGYVYALNAATGSPVWSSLTEDEASANGPAVADGVVYVASSDGSTYAFDAFTGAQLWSATTGSIEDSSPAVANGVVYIGSTNGNVYALDAATGDELWAFTTGAEVLSSPAVVNGELFIGSTDHNVYAFDLAGGTAGVRRPVPGQLHPDRRLRPELGRRS